MLPSSDITIKHINIKIAFNDRNTIDVKVELELSKKIKIHNQHLIIEIKTSKILAKGNK